MQCDDIVNSTQCVNNVFNLIGKKCVLVESKEPICMVESCFDINDINKCDGYSSALGKCFLNKDIDINQNLTQKSCTNTEDIEHCNQLFTLSLCNSATTSIYPSLQGDGINRYPCNWDPAVQMCQSRVENEKDILTQTKSNIALIVVIVVLSVVVVLLITVVIVILFRLRATKADPEQIEIEMMNQNEKGTKKKSPKTSVRF
jgi:hypothetical protein